MWAELQKCLQKLATFFRKTSGSARNQNIKWCSEFDQSLNMKNSYQKQHCVSFSIFSVGKLLEFLRTLPVFKSLLFFEVQSKFYDLFSNVSQRIVFFLQVSFSIVSINVGILGFMTFWGVRLDFISMVTIVMSIGFCVDFAAHLAYNFSKVFDFERTLTLSQSMCELMFWLFGASPRPHKNLESSPFSLWIFLKSVKF